MFSMNDIYPQGSVPQTTQQETPVTVQNTSVISEEGIPVINEDVAKQVAREAAIYSLDNQENIYNLVAPLVRDDMKSNMLNPDPKYYFDKAVQIDRQLKEAPGVFEEGLEKGLIPSIYRAGENIPLLSGQSGVAIYRGVRDLGDFVSNNTAAVLNTVAGTANTLFGSPYKLQAYGKDSVFGTYDEREIERVKSISENKYARNWAYGRRNIFQTMADIYTDSPEFVSSSQAIASSMRAAVKNPALIEAREVDESTRFWRPEATYLEQIVRTIPEFVGGVKLGAMILKRGHDTMMTDLAKIHNTLVQEGKNSSKAIDIPNFISRSDKKKFAKSNPFAEINDADLMRAITKLKEDKIIRFGTTITSDKYHGFMKNAYANRVASNVQITRMRDAIRQSNRKIRDEKNIIALNAKERLEKEERLYNLRRERWGAVPNAIKGDYLAEAGATLGAIAVGNYLGEEYAWMGALGGGLTSGLGHKAVMTVYQGTKQYGRAFIGDALRAAKLMDNLSEAERMSLIRRGKLPIAAEDRISKQEVTLLNNMGTLFMSLPEHIRVRALNSMISFEKDIASLKDSGIDTSILETTFDKVSNLQPFMVLKDSLGQASINSAKNLSKEFDQDVISVIEADIDLEGQAKVFRELIDQLKTQRGPNGEILTGTQEVFTKNIRQLEGMYTKLTTDLESSHKIIYGNIESIFDILSDPTLRTTQENVSVLSSLRNGIMEQLNRIKLEDVGDGLLSDKTNQIKQTINNLTSMTSKENTQLILNTFDSLQKDLDAMDSLIKNPVFGEGSDLVGSENMGFRLAGFLEHKAATSKIAANQNYEDIKNYVDYNRLDEDGNAKPLTFNMTQWFRDLPEDGRLREDGSILPMSAADRVEQKLSGKFIREEKDLQSLLSFTSLDGVKDYFERLSNRDARRFVNYLLDQADKDTKEGIENTLARYNNYGDKAHKELLLGESSLKLRAMFGMDGKSLPDNLSLFDEVDAIHKELIKNNIDPRMLEPQMRMDAINVKEFSSTFNSISRSFREKGERKKARDYGSFGRSLLSHAADRSAQRGIDARNFRGEKVEYIKDLAEANTFWLYNVLYPNQSKIGSNIFRYGDQVTARTDIDGDRPFGTGNYEENPELWLDNIIGDNIANGSAEQARQVIKELKIAFGTFNPDRLTPTTIYSKAPEDFAYEIDDEKAKKLVGDLLNNYIERFYRRQISGPLERVKEKMPTPQTTEEGIEAMQEVLAARATRPTQDLPRPRRVTREYSAQNIAGELREDLRSAKDARDTLHSLVLDESDFLKTLNNEGYIDVAGFQTKTSEIREISMSKEAFDDAEEIILKNLEGDKKQTILEVEKREKIANTIFDFLDLKRVAGMESHEQVLRTFVEGGASIANVARINKLIGTELGPWKASEFKNVLSDLVMDAMLFRAGNLSPDASQLTSAQLRNFDYNEVGKLVTTHSQALKTIMGDEKFDILEKLSNIIGVKNTSANDMASNAGLAIKVPGGLSLESMISRLYSISRGVISPKYVLTEAALLKIRKTNASILKKVLNDPKTANRLLTILGQADTPSSEVLDFIQKHDKKIFQYIRSALIENKIEKERRLDEIKREKQNPRLQ